MNEFAAYKEFFEIYDSLLKFYCKILNNITGGNPNIETYDFAVNEICSNIDEHNGKTLGRTNINQNRIYFSPSLFNLWLFEKTFKSAYKNESDILLNGNDVLLYVACHEYVHCVYKMRNHTLGFRNITVQLFNAVKLYIPII